MRDHRRLLVCLLVGALFPVSVLADSYPTLTYRYNHHLFTIDPDRESTWLSNQEVWRYHGASILPPQSFRVDGDVLPPLPAGIVKGEESGWNADAIAATIRARISSVLDRPAGTVAIDKDADGKVTFEGLGLTGIAVDADRAAALTIDAVTRGITDIVLPVEETQPKIAVLDPDLSAMGIREVVSIGDSNFARSPNARRHNIAVGAAQFNGHIIPQGTEFSFNETLGPVGPQTGYKKELVILGDRTMPDYGGGLCQVSTTAYRGIWEYGFPILDRRNHSFAVQYYAPQGTDATIYPPRTDMKFLNDSPGALLIQTHIDGDNAYFIYYGTRDDRQSEVIGPYTWDTKAPPADKIEYTTDIPPGTTKLIGHAVPGLKAAWFRMVTPHEGSGETLESFYSWYEARPNFTQIGVTALIMPQVESLSSVSSKSSVKAGRGN